MSAQIGNDIYGREVYLDTTDPTKDVYSLENGVFYSFAHGTPQSAAYVAFARQGKAVQTQSQILDFTLSHYDRDTRVALSILFQMAKENGLTARAAYIATALNWVNSLITALVTFQVSVQSQTDPATIAAMQFDFSSISADPCVTLAAVIAISN